MNLTHQLATGDVAMLDVARDAHARQVRRLYLDQHGELVTALQPQPGWVRIAVKVKSPTAANLERIPCAA
jgi:hypothetical protein